MKISGFTDEAGFKLDDQIAILSELNQHFMCPRKLNDKNIADYTPDEFMSTIWPVLSERGIKISSIGSPIGKVDVYDDAGYAAQLEKLKSLVEIAKRTGTKYIRTFSFFVGDGDYDKAFAEVVKKVRGFLELVHGTDIILLHENEKKIYGDIPDRVLKLFNEIDDKQYKLCYDASNYIQCGVEPYGAYLAVKPYTVYYHMKDCVDGIEVPLATGDGKIKEIIADLAKDGYDGFLTLEPHTWKYALLKRAVYALPPVGGLKKLRVVYSKIDKDAGKSRFERVTRKEVYKWQYENLKKILIAEGVQYE